STPDETPTAIASLAKMMTAYVVLKAHPLSTGETGPTVTVTASDVALYNQEKATQSVVPIVAGEQLNEYQLLEGLLIPSGNDYAHILADWVAGSQASFVQIMNADAKKLGMTHTHYTDASGVSAATVSTAADQLIIAEHDMRNATFRSIVAMPQATLPVANVVYNVNYWLGHSGIIGVKTGSTAAAGGCYVAAAYRNAGSQKVLVLAAVLGQQSATSELYAAFHAGENLLNAVPFLEVHQVVGAGAAGATVDAPWLTTGVNALVPSAISMIGWPGLKVHLTFTARPLPKTVIAGTPVGTLHVTAGQQVLSLPLRASGDLPGPSKHWRLTRL
ncbi:MAG: D-alanyl-D-alanine carboxypeptidase family protein, partial [Clostridia bacterium]